ncbi:MAG: hypothetical protein KIS85_08990 [Anaerolineales bacterium]|nr:hypothetical protein [Anaerolineales bacterium]
MKYAIVLTLAAGWLLAACAALPSASTPTPDPGPVCCAPEPSGGAVFVDRADLLVMESFPVQVALMVSGNLPTPCHTLHYEVAEADAENRIRVMMWSEADPAAMCAQVLQPFEESVRISMEGAGDGTYSVWLNGELVGEFSYPG